MFSNCMLCTICLFLSLKILHTALTVWMDRILVRVFCNHTKLSVVTYGKLKQAPDM